MGNSVDIVDALKLLSEHLTLLKIAPAARTASAGAEAIESLRRQIREIDDQLINYEGHRQRREADACNAEFRRSDGEGCQREAL